MRSINTRADLQSVCCVKSNNVRGVFAGKVYRSSPRRFPFALRFCSAQVVKGARTKNKKHLPPRAKRA